MVKASPACALNNTSPRSGPINSVDSTSPKVTSSVVPTGCPIAIVPSVIVTPVPPLKCALTSLAEGPVYVITPVDEL